MTTILGIETNTDEPAVTLAADTQLNIYDAKGEEIKGDRSKIAVGSHYAIAYAGMVNKYVERFFSYLQGEHDFDAFLRFTAEEEGHKKLREMAYTHGKTPRILRERLRDLLAEKIKPDSPVEQLIVSHAKKERKGSSELDDYFFRLIDSANPEDPVQCAIRLGYFQELDILNRYIVKRDQEEEDNTLFLLMASNKTRPRLHEVDNWGNVEPVEPDKEVMYALVGSGKGIIDNYMDGEEYKDDPYVKSKIPGEIKLDHLTSRTACVLAVGALQKAIKKDKDSGGAIEVVVVKKDGVSSYGNVLREKLKEAVQSSYDFIFDREASDSEPKLLK